MHPNPKTQPAFTMWIDPHKAAARQHGEIARLTGLGQGRMLEIGCGEGEYLAVMQEKNWEALGIEADAGSVAACMSKNVLALQGCYAEVGVARASFDIVRIRGGLVSTPNPMELLQFAFDSLRPTGYLIAETWNGSGLPCRPHRDSLLHRYTKTSLHAMALQAGFEGGGVIAPALGDPVWAPWIQTARRPALWRRWLDHSAAVFDRGSLLVLFSQRPPQR
ncbi:MAG: class I SAM-dependent methyltransferase [bacterium]|jgi:SAM-dependent methyltransferase|nr:class I SAM-dependent methyltransferase [bacterium]